MRSAMGELLEIGRVARAHGLRGEVIVALSSERTERLDPGSVLATAEGTLEVVSSRPHQQRWLVQFDGIATREQADALRGTVLSAEPIEDDRGDVLWVHRLVGARVELGDGTVVGRIESVQDNPAHDLLVLAEGQLVPVVFVTDASGLPERIVIDPPEGLLELQG